MPLWPNFIGPAYPASSSTIAMDNCFNLYLETTQNAASPKKAALYGTPAQKFVLRFPAPSSGCRGLFNQDGRIFGVSSTQFFEYVPGTGFINIASVANDFRPVTFACNGIGGNQLLVCAAGNLYIFNLVTNVLTGPLTLAGGFVPVMVGYMDGYFLANEKDTPKMWFSHLFDGTQWDATDFFTRSSTSDNIIGFVVNNRRIWLVGSKSTEIFQDSGDATTPFIPYPGTVINEGTLAWTSITSIADTVFWVGSTREFGQQQIFAASGLQPRAISNPAISAQIARSTNVTEPEALAYTQGGHDFICWTWPSIEQTWCYDLTESAWHLRARIVQGLPGQFSVGRWQARGACSFNPVSGGQPAVLVGQWGPSTALCQLDLGSNVDYDESAPNNALVIIRQRTAPYLSAENQWIFLQQVELGLDLYPPAGTEGLYAETIKADGAAMYFRLDETSGTTVTSDVGSYTGAITGGVTLGQPGIAARYSPAMVFDGTSGQIALTPTLTMSATFSLEAWIMTVPGRGDQAILCALLAPTPPPPPVNLGGFFFGTRNNRLLLIVDGALSGIVSVRPVADTQWHHVVATSDGEVTSLYVDGVLDTQVTYQPHNPGTPSAMIGADLNHGSFFQGTLDEIAWYPGVLTAAQVQDHYTLGLSAAGLRVPNLQLLLSGTNGLRFTQGIDGAPGLTLDGEGLVQWFQLGRYRADRLVIAIRSIVDQPCIWGPGLWMRTTPGTGQL